MPKLAIILFFCIRIPVNEKSIAKLLLKQTTMLFNVSPIFLTTIARSC
jgi:hypothetical protein